MLSLREAFNNGYRTLPDGTVVSPGGLIRKTSPWKGYLRFSTSFGVVWVHKLVAYQKFGEESLKKGIQVRHLNNNSFDNSWDNIAIGSAHDNMMDVPENVRRRRSANTARKIDSRKALAIILDRRGGLTYEQLALKYGVKKSTLSYLFTKSLYAKAIMLGRGLK